MPQSASAPASDRAAAVPIARPEALALYRRLLLIRRAEERIRAEYARDEMKTPVHLGIGQEAIALGVAACLPPGSATFGTYRNHALYLAVTDDATGFFGELYGRQTGPGRGKAGSMHMASPAHGMFATSAVVATTIPVAVGAAFAAAYRRSEQLTAVFFGDGAIEEGVFWESLNFACLHRLRILFVCEDNDLAIHTPTRARQGFRSIPEAIAGFRCHVASGPGSDLVEVMAQTRALLARMQVDPQPGLLHLRYFRFLEHVGPREDFSAGYRPAPSPEARAAQDPVHRMEQTLDALGVSGAERVAVRDQVEQQLTEAVQRAQQAPFAPPAALLEDVFA